MVINLESAKARKRIGTKPVYCPWCGGVVSFSDSRPFCRKCRAFNIIMDGAEVSHESG